MRLHEIKSVDDEYLAADRWFNDLLRALIASEVTLLSDFQGFTFVDDDDAIEVWFHPDDEGELHVKLFTSAMKKLDWVQDVKLGKDSTTVTIKPTFSVKDTGGGRFSRHVGEFYADQRQARRLNNERAVKDFIL